MIKFFSLAYQKYHKFYFSISIAIIHLDILLVSNKLKVQIAILKGLGLSDSENNAIIIVKQ